MAGSIKDRLSKAVSGDSGLDFDPLARDEVQFVRIRLADIETDPEQPRKELGDLTDLMQSIQEHGLIHPIVVEPLDNRRYRILAGERRFSACKLAGLEIIPSLVRTIEEHQRLAFQLTENLTRKDLDPFEEAQGYRRLMDEFNLTQEEVGRRVGKSQPVVNETLRILDLPQKFVEDYRTSDKLSKSLLLEITKQPPEDWAQLWQSAKQGLLTVKKVRELKPKREPQSETTQPAAGKKNKTVFSTHHDASVIVQSLTDTITHQQTIQALREALQKAEGKD